LLQQNYAGCRDKLSRFWKRLKVVVMSRGIEVVRPCRAPAQYQLRYLQGRLRRMDLETLLDDASISSAILSAIGTSLPYSFLARVHFASLDETDRAVERGGWPHSQHDSAAGRPNLG
jgi:hypothetical protein